MPWLPPPQESCHVVVPLVRAVSTMRLGSDVANPVLSHRPMAPMTVHLFSELDSRAFLGECTGAFGVVYGNSPAFCLAHGSSAVTWALPDPVLTRVHLVFLPFHVFSLLHRCQIEHCTWLSATHPKLC